MGMLYVLDEPSIGLHPKDNVKMIATLESLRDIGNTVIVVEHDEDTIRAADHIVEMGPGPGVHGGTVVVQGTFADVLQSKASPTGQFLSGKRSIAMPKQRRTGNGKVLTVRGARENNLKNVDVAIPLGKLVAITGASGSGKSSLVNEILFKVLWKHLVDTRTLPGEHDAVDGIEHVHKVVNIDQSPIGRNSRSNPATYIGFYDTIRDLFTQAPLSVERGYKAGRFSFNVKGGRCEECQGEGAITTELYFMPDVEVTCGSCKGARFNSDAADQNRHRAEYAATLEAHALHPRRADDWAASGGRRAAARIAESPGRCRAHGAAHRASSRRHQDGRSRHRSRSRGRPRRRHRRRRRRARGCGKVQGVTYREVPEGALTSRSVRFEADRIRPSDRLHSGSRPWPIGPTGPPSTAGANGQASLVRWP
jgi:energy-coupling factor transporter ATP-binding protein EcfA2